MTNRGVDGDDPWTDNICRFPCPWHCLNILPVPHTSNRKKSSWRWQIWRIFGKYGGSWKRIDETDLHAHIGLPILAGACRFWGEAAASKMQKAEGRFCHVANQTWHFHAYSRLLRCDDHAWRPARRVTDKLGAMRKVCNKRGERLPYFYSPYLHWEADQWMPREGPGDASFAWFDGGTEGQVQRHISKFLHLLWTQTAASEEERHHGWLSVKEQATKMSGQPR